MAFVYAEGLRILWPVSPLLQPKHTEFVASLDIFNSSHHSLSLRNLQVVPQSDGQARVLAQAVWNTGVLEIGEPPKPGVSMLKWFNMDDLGVPSFSEMFIYTYVVNY